MRSGEFTDIRALLERSTAMKRIREHFRGGDLQGAWSEVAGPAVARSSRARRFRGGKLHVDVFSAPLLQELATYQKPTLLTALRGREGFEKLVDIVFRHGQPPAETDERRDPGAGAPEKGS